MGPFCYLCFVFVCHTALSVPCSFVVTCWKVADLLTLLCFVTLPYGVIGKAWYLIVSVLDLCLLPYMVRFHFLMALKV